MSLVVLAMMVDSPSKDHFVGLLAGYGYDETFRTLFGITQKLMTLDESSLSLAQKGAGDFLLLNHYRYLFTGPDTSAEVCLDGSQHAQTALRVLEFLCADPPRTIPYHKSPRKRRKAPKSLSGYGGALIQQSQLRLPRTAQGNQLLIAHSRLGEPRKQREEKHRYGIALSLPDTDVTTLEDNGTSWREIPCEFGLRLLPEILAKSSKSPELVDSIRTNGKKIACIPNQTWRAIRAMHDYLNRTDDRTSTRHTQHI